MTYEDVRELPKEWYNPSLSYEYYDEKEDQFYNVSGNKLRHPAEYKPDSDGVYEPFGDE